MWHTNLQVYGAADNVWLPFNREGGVVARYTVERPMRQQGSDVSSDKAARRCRDNITAAFTEKVKVNHVTTHILRTPIRRRRLFSTSTARNLTRPSPQIIAHDALSNDAVSNTRCMVGA